MQYNNNNNTINFNSNPIYKVFMNNNLNTSMNKDYSHTMKNISIPAQNYNLNTNMEMRGMYNINNKANINNNNNNRINNNNIQWNNLNNTMNENMLNNNYLNYLNNTWKLYQMFNQMNKANSQIISNKMKFINNNKQTNSNRFIFKQNSKSDYDYFPGYSGKRFNIIFTIPTGSKMNILCPPNVKVKELLQIFIARLGLGQDAIFNNSIFFLYNGYKLNYDDNRTIVEIGMNNLATIIALDPKNLLGA